MKIADFTVKIGPVKVDAIPPFVQLAADTAAAYKEIDSLHASQSERCFLAASRSPYYNHPSFTGGGIEREIYARKYLGLVLAAIAEGRDSPFFARVFNIMANRWTSLHRYITESQEVFLDEVVDPQYHSPAVKKAGGSLLSGVVGHYFDSFVSVYPVLDLPRQAALKFALFSSCALGRKASVKNPEILAEIEVMSGKTPITKNFRDINRRLSAPDFRKVTREIKNAIFQRVRPDFRRWDNDRFIEGWAHCGAYLSAEEGIPLLGHEFLTAPKDREVELLCRLYFIKITAEMFRYGPVDQTKDEVERECAEFVMFGLIWLGLVREYKKARKYYSAHGADHLRGEMKAMEEKLADGEEQLRKAKDALAAKDRMLCMKDQQASEQARRHKLELDALNEEIARLKSEASRDAQPAAEDTAGGIAAAPGIMPESPPLPGSDVAHDLMKLRGIRAVVIGGTEKWQAKLSSRLPHFVYLYGDAAGFDESLVINADIVFADTRYKFNHGCFYRLANIVRRHNKKLVFLSRTNTALAVRQMALAVECH